MKRFLLLMCVLSTISLISNAQNQYENGGFEAWEDVGFGEDKMEPVDWSSVKTSDNESLNGVAPILWDRSTDAHSGNYSVHLFNVETLGIKATGAITNGRAHTELILDNAFMYTDPNDDRWNSVMQWRPDSVVGWYKCSPVGDDFGTIKVALHKGEIHIPGDEDSFIGLAYYEFPSETVESWTRFSVPIQYFSDEKPEYQLSILTSGNGVTPETGSEIWFDDLAFVYNNNSIDDNFVDKINVYAFNRSINISINGIENESYKLIISDIMGRHVFSKETYNGEKLTYKGNLTSGIYFITATKGQKAYTKKVLIN